MIFRGGGQGNGIASMRGIIHDFIRYNEIMQADLAQLLRSRLSSRQMEILQETAAEASSRGLPVYVVGGLLRDLVLRREISDFDLVVEGNAILLARAVAGKHGGQLISHSRFGTAKWVLSQSTLSPAGEAGDHGGGQMGLDHIDFITARSEEYSKPANLPEVRPGGIDDDLRRRDFTINTLAVRLDGQHFGEVHDPFCALQDLEHRMVRVLHPLSFRHDPTRMYRAVRYEKRYDFQIASETLALIREARAHVRELSPHRIRQELDHILEEERAAPMLRRLAKLDLLRPIHEALPADRAALARLQRPSANGRGWVQLRFQDFRWLLWLMGLAAGEIRSINRRLHFRKELLEDLVAASKLQKNSASLTRWRPSQITTYLDGFPPLAVSAAQAGAPDEKIRSLLAEYLDKWRYLKPSTTGRDLKRLGLTPGPAYRQILGELRREWLDGGIKNQIEERARLETMVRRQSGGEGRIPARAEAHKAGK